MKTYKTTQFKYHNIPPTYHNLSLHNSVHQPSPFSTQPSALGFVIARTKLVKKGIKQMTSFILVDLDI